MIKKLLTSKIFLVLVLIVLALVTYHLIRITKHKYQLKSELEPLNKEIKQVKQEKKELSQNFNYFKTESFAEKEAREKLNLKKKGEEVIIVAPGEEKLREDSLNPNLEQLTQKQNQKEGPNNNSNDQTQKKTSKVLVWWNYFFGN